MSKELSSRWDQNILLQVNEEEIKVLQECVSSDHFMERALQYLSKKSKC